MSLNELTAKQVRRSIERFGNYGQQLERSDVNTFDDRVAMFLDFCQSDATLSRMHSQLIDAPGVDIDRFVKEAQSSRALFFPSNLDQRLALMYRLLWKLRSDDFRWREFFPRVIVLTSGRWNDFINCFNEAVTSPMLTEIGYKLDDVLAELPEDGNQRVSGSIVQVITNTGSFVQQLAPGAGVAVMNTVNTSELRHLIGQLQSAIQQTDIDASAKQVATDHVNAMAEEAESPAPRVTVLRSLLNGFPTAVTTVAGIAKIAEALQQAFGTP